MSAVSPAFRLISIHATHRCFHFIGIFQSEPLSAIALYDKSQMTLDPGELSSVYGNQYIVILTYFL